MMSFCAAACIRRRWISCCRECVKFLLSSQVMGSLADEKCAQGQRLSGILVKKNFNYHILNPCDLSSESLVLHIVPTDNRMKYWKTYCACFAAYTELSMSTVKQSQAIPFTGPYSLLVCHLRNLTGNPSATDEDDTVAVSCRLMMSSLVSGDVEELDGTEKNTLKIFKNITLVHEVGMVMLEVSQSVAFKTQDCSVHVFICPLFQWIANPLNDMYADAVTTVVLEVQSNPKAQKGPFYLNFTLMPYITLS